MKKLKVKGFISIVLSAAVLLAFTGCTNSKLQKEDESKGAAESSSSADSASTPTGNPASSKEDKASKGENPVVTIEMDNGKTIKLELYPDIAPNTVKNIISLVKAVSMMG